MRSASRLKDRLNSKLFNANLVAHSLLSRLAYDRMLKLHNAIGIFRPNNPSNPNELTATPVVLSLLSRSAYDKMLQWRKAIKVNRSNRSTAVIQTD